MNSEIPTEEQLKNALDKVAELARPRRTGHPSMLDVAGGAVAGLVGIDLLLLIIGICAGAIGRTIPGMRDVVLVFVTTSVLANLLAMLFLGVGQIRLIWDILYDVVRYRLGFLTARAMGDHQLASQLEEIPKTIAQILLDSLRWELQWIENRISTVVGRGGFAALLASLLALYLAWRKDSEVERMIALAIALLQPLSLGFMLRLEKLRRMIWLLEKRTRQA